MQDRFVIICTPENQDLVTYLKGELSPDDEIIVTNIPKYPTRFFEKIYFTIKDRFDWLLLINNNSRYFSPDFMSSIRKNKVFDGIIFKRTDDLESEEGLIKLSNRLIMNDDSLCIPLRIFKGFRDITPQTDFSGVIKNLSLRYTTYGDASRNIVGYNDIMKEKRELLELEGFYNSKLKNTTATEPMQEVQKIIYESDIQKRKVAIEIFWQEEIKKKKQKEERMMRTVPYAMKKINKNGTTSIVSKVSETCINNDKYVGNWCTWMEGKDL
jgi:hypothetical protein